MLRMTQTKISEIWKKKSGLINEFYSKAENRKHTTFRINDRKNCAWCAKFAELNMNCLNCGSVHK